MGGEGRGGEGQKKVWDKLSAFPESAALRTFRSFLKRMWNASAFMQMLKQHFTMSFNGRREHAGTMWEGRFHSRVHKSDDFGMGGSVCGCGVVDE